MPRIIRLRYHVEPLPSGTLSVRNWLELLTREELINVHEWAEPWPMLWTLSDAEAVAYCRRHHPDGPTAFLIGREVIGCGIRQPDNYFLRPPLPDGGSAA